MIGFGRIWSSTGWLAEQISAGAARLRRPSLRPRGRTTSSWRTPARLLGTAGPAARTLWPAVRGPTPVYSLAAAAGFAAWATISTGDARRARAHVTIGKLELEFI